MWMLVLWILFAKQEPSYVIMSANLSKQECVDMMTKHPREQIGQGILEYTCEETVIDE